MLVQVIRFLKGLHGCMKKLIFLLLVSSIAIASDERWHGFNVFLAPLGEANYELTLYRTGAEPVTSHDYQTADLKAINVCTNGKVSTWEQADTLAMDSYTVISRSLDNTHDHAAITYDFHCNY